MTLDIIYDIDKDESFESICKHPGQAKTSVLEMIERYEHAKRVFGTGAIEGRVMNPGVPKEIAAISDWIKMYNISSLDLE